MFLAPRAAFLARSSHRGMDVCDRLAIEVFQLRAGQRRHDQAWADTVGPHPVGKGAVTGDETMRVQPLGVCSLSGIEHSRQRNVANLKRRVRPVTEIHPPKQLITIHHKTRAHSCFEGNPWLRELDPQRLWLSAGDARARGIGNGDEVRVFNDRGETVIRARVTERIMPGVVALGEGAWYRPDERGCDLAGSPNQRLQVDTTSEKRLYFMWNSPSPLMQYDRQLLQQAGVPLPNRQMLKFIPPPLENELAVLELEYARERGHQSVTEIAKTIFESKGSGDGYAFEVIDQRYRIPRR